MAGAKKSDTAQTVKDLAGKVDEQYYLIQDLRGELEALRDELEFVRADVDDLQAVKITKKKGAKNGR